MDDQKNMISITVLIGGRPYPLRIVSTDEPSIRKIVKEINDNINSFQLKYTTKDKQDCLAMAVLTYAVDLEKSKSNTNDPHKKIDSTNNQKEIFEKLSLLDSLLDSALEQ